MKKILLSVGSILFAGALLAGGTGAFMNNQNTSTGNTFASGVIDLKVDNESYFTDDFGKLVFSPTTSWSLSSLAGKLFFNFLDIKPGDIGEDTISLHVSNNNAWACMNVKITAKTGELQNYVNFVFWADDGDNVYEKGEKIFKRGLAKDIFDGKNWTIADASGNIWSCYKKDSILANSVKYIGKAWCFGKLTESPVNQDGKGKTGNNGPLVRGTGIKCDGKDVGNIAQNDSIKADVSFIVEQSRNNSEFTCKDNHDDSNHKDDKNNHYENNNDDHDYKDKKN
jgi:hypothetical protein